jgi:hypothetical protein
MAGNLSALLIEIQELFSKLEIIGFGGETDSVVYNGVSRGSIAKSISDEIASRWVAIASIAQSRNVVEAKSSLPASSDGSTMYDVWNDSNESNNGLYGWSGGAWVKSPFDVNRVAQDARARVGKNWLAPFDGFSFRDLTYGDDIAGAILAVRGYGMDLTETYHIGLMAHNHSVYKDRIIIHTSAGGNGWDTDNVVVGDQSTGPVWVVATKSGGSRFEILIDYRLLDGIDGLLVNTTDPYFKFSPQVVIDGELSSAVTNVVARASEIESKFADVLSSAQANTSFRSVDPAIFLDASYVEFMACVQSYYLNSLPRDKDYRVGIFQYSSPSETSKFWVIDGDLVKYSWEGSLLASGIQMIELSSSTGTISIVLNLDMLTEHKIYVNNWASPFVFGAGEVSAAAFSKFLNNEEFRFVDYSRLNIKKSEHVRISKAIIGARLLSGDPSRDYSIIVFSHNDDQYANDIWINDENGLVAQVVGLENTVDEAGITRVVIPEHSGSGVEIELFIDYQSIADLSGLLINGEQIWLKFGSSSIPALVADSVAASAAELRAESSVALGRNLRMSFIGSSTTWGQGFLGEESYVGFIENYVRNNFATTIEPSQMLTMGAWQIFDDERMCYRSAIGKLSGVGSTIDFDIYGDEISVALCKERGNAGAAIVELLIDGQVYDSFSTFNPLPAGSDVFTFVGDGVSKSFDLGRAFTYSHEVTLDSSPVVGELSQGGFGGTFGASDIWMVVRKLVNLGGGEYGIHHFLTFKNPPAAGVSIRCEYDFGESIKPTKSTVGNVGAEIGSGIESALGDASTSSSASRTLGMSSGLDFRQNDERSVQTWRFSRSEVRRCSLRIKSLDPRATGLAPELFVGFITNRMHYFQNAGIGGFMASNFFSENSRTNLRHVASFKPDFVSIKLAANDDWSVHEFKAWNVRAGVSRSELAAVETAYYLRGVSGAGDSYTVEDSRCPIAAISPFSVTFDSSVSLGAVAAGDQIIFGDYHGDNRRLVVRLVDLWDGHTAFFKTELMPDDLIYMQSISELVGETAQVKSIALWEQNIRTIIGDLKAYSPGLKFGLSTDGLPNYKMRRLEGYADVAQSLSNEISSVEFVDAYGATKRWTYGTPQDASVYINQGQGIASTGSDRYSLYLSNDAVWDTRAPRNLSVLVDGVERINDDCHLEGGQKKGWRDDVVDLSLENISTINEQNVLVFTDNIPTAGAVISVSYSSKKWSPDDCHPYTSGNELFAIAQQDVLKRFF